MGIVGDLGGYKEREIVLYSPLITRRAGYM
jgi:hypothetical protein